MSVSEMYTISQKIRMKSIRIANGQFYSGIIDVK